MVAFETMVGQNPDRSKETAAHQMVYRAEVQQNFHIKCDCPRVSDCK